MVAATIGALVAASLSTGARAEVSAWLASWDPPEAVATAITHARKLDRVWAMSLSVDGAATPPRISYALTPAMEKLREAIGKLPAKKRPCFGAVLHNAANGGFDAALGKKLSDARADVSRQLAAIVAREKLGCLNVDLESLAPEAAASYEALLTTLRDTFKKTKVEVSAALHAQSANAPVSEHARFQRWKEIATIGVPVVIMAYDHAWATSAPGPVAPSAWVESVAKHAVATFGKAKTTIALPLYGYDWTADGKGGWQGKPGLAHELAQAAQGMRPDVQAAGDGRLLRSGTTRAIAFDDATALVAKWRTIVRPLGARVAFWRLGGDDATVYDGVSR